jgi:transforming growth factor-beta-induced protein
MRIHRTTLVSAIALTACAILAPPLHAQEQQQPQTVLSLLQEQGNHTTFLRAIRAAGMEETLQGKGPYTVFAPTDAAFEKLPKEELDGLFSDPSALKELVSSHVAANAIRSTDLKAPMNVATMEGNSLRFQRDGETLTLAVPAPAAEVGGNGTPPVPVTATVVKADIPASNGVIHEIDAVLWNKD